MSTCNSGSTVCSPCGFSGVPDPANESLESALANFTEQFFGGLTKTAVNGAVVWTLPCDLATGLEGNPRLEGEGLACYFLRLMEEGATGEVPAIRTIDTQYSLTGGGNLSADRTLNLVNDVASPGNLKVYGTDSGGTRGWQIQGAPTTRSVATQYSLTGGGDLSADRTLSLVNDAASPGNSKYYGTNAGGSKGFHDLPAADGGSPAVFATVAATTVSSSTAPETTLLGSVRAGESKTLDANSITSGTVLKIEACGRFSSADSDWANSILRVKIGGSLQCAFTFEEPDNEIPADWFWEVVVWVTITTAAASAATVVTGRITYEYNTVSGTTPTPLMLQGVVSGTLDTTVSNAVDVTLDNATGGELTMSCRHALVTRY